jgi:hypothetical protein
MEGGKVRQHWESSQDAGRTWKTVFDGLYTPRAARRGPPRTGAA